MQPEASPDSPEEVGIVLRDGFGRIYVVPEKHMKFNLVEAEVHEEFAGEIESLPRAGERVSYEVIGSFKLPRDLRRRYVRPLIDQISVDRPMPTS